MQERFLVIDKDGIWLLGYPLRLTPTETKLLTFITERGEASAQLLCSLLNEGVSRQNVAVHISAIKAVISPYEYATVILATTNIERDVERSFDL